MFIFFILVIFVQVCVSDNTDNVTTLCESNKDVCVCKYDQNNDRDFLNVIIDCSYNDVRILETYSLPESVHTLDLSSNNYTVLSVTNLLTSDNMEVLLLNNNRITHINVGALLLPALKILDLSYNELEFISPEIFRYTRKLTYLNLSSNRFKMFTDNTFKYLNNLNEIVLDNNAVGRDLYDNNPFQLLGLNKGIKIMSLRSIGLNEFPENFLLDAYDLRSLHLSGNNFTSIPELPFTLECLDLSDNPISRIEAEDISELIALKELRLNNLLIKEIPDFVFASLKTLEVLELERNKNLTKFSSLAFGQEVLDDPDDFTLESLSIRGSRIVTMEKELEIPLGHLMRLDLQGNPWRCDCKLRWLKRLQIKPEDYDHVRCAEPQGLFNARVFDLDKKYFKCKIEKQFGGAGLVIAFICLLLAAIALWVFLFLPKQYTRWRCLKHLHPSVNYVMLPINPNAAENRY